jgi:hypothetical protein
VARCSVAPITPTLIPGPAIALLSACPLISIIMVLSALPSGCNVICCAGCSLHVGPGLTRVSDAACSNHSGEQDGNQSNGKRLQGALLLQVALERIAAPEVAWPAPRLDLQRYYPSVTASSTGSQRIRSIAIPQPEGAKRRVRSGRDRQSASLSDGAIILDSRKKRPRSGAPLRPPAVGPADR